jgi:hypothetical protein
MMGVILTFRQEPAEAAKHSRRSRKSNELKIFYPQITQISQIKSE